MACFTVSTRAVTGGTDTQVFYKRDFARDDFYSRCANAPVGSTITMYVDGQEMARVLVQEKDTQPISMNPNRGK